MSNSSSNAITSSTVSRLSAPKSSIKLASGTTLDRVTKIVIEQLSCEEDKVVPEASFIDDLGADSLDTVELVMAFEEEFDIEIPDEVAETIQTVADAVAKIDEHAS